MKSQSKKKLPSKSKLKTVFSDIRKQLRQAYYAMLSMIKWAGILIWRFSWRVAIVLFILLVSSVYYYYSKMPEIDSLYDGRTRGSITLKDRNENIFAWRGQQYGGPVTVKSVSQHLINAILAVEDHNFYRHFGISPRGIAGAMIINVREGRNALEGHGGSTITQQVAKLICYGSRYNPKLWKSQAEFEQDCRQPSLWRKIKEIPFAIALEFKFTKDEILALYLNRVYLGAGSTGVEAASQRYFAIPSSTLSISQSAMIASLLSAPSLYSPTRSINRAQQRTEIVIQQMKRRGYLTNTQARLAIDNPAVLATYAASRAGGYFVDWVLDSGPSFLTHNQTEDLVINTTFDRDIQQAVDGAVEHIFTTKIKSSSNAQIAVIVMSKDGTVHAMIGGRDIKASGYFNRASNALRQTGSLFKPIVFATALENGWQQNDIIRDQPISIKVSRGYWTPRNYNNKQWGNVTLTKALANSINTIAVQLSEKIGRNQVRETARRLGVRSLLAKGPSVALGVSEASLVEMTGVYASILNGGWKVVPNGLRSIHLNSDNSLLMKSTNRPNERAISGKTARQLVDMMHEVINSGTGRRGHVEGLDLAGKTGTTQEARDAWFIGYSGYYVTGVWMGYDDNTPLTGVTGGGLPAEIWREIMVRIHEGLPYRSLPHYDLSKIEVSKPQIDSIKTPEVKSDDRSDTIIDLISRILGGN